MKSLLVIILFSFSLPALAKLNVISTTPDLLWLIENIGGSRVIATSVLDGSEDPHFADAMPSWIAKASNADVFCLVGLELEVGWVPKVLERSANKTILPGGKGYCEVGKYISALGKKTGHIDRSMGDVHASGNPHYHLGPEQYKNAAKGIFDILISNDPNGINEYDKNLQITLKKINDIKIKVSNLLKNDKKVKIMSYHKEFSYFVKDFGLTYFGDIEEVPGVPPSAGRIARVALDAKRNNVKIVLASNAHPKKLLEKFKEISGVEYKQLPLSIRKSGYPSNYEELLVTMAKAISGIK